MTSHGRKICAVGLAVFALAGWPAGMYAVLTAELPPLLAVTAGVTLGNGFGSLLRAALDEWKGRA